MSKEVACPTCKTKKPYNGNPHRPFCSERCKLIDLGNWADETYAVPADEPAGPLDLIEDEPEFLN